MLCLSSARASKLLQGVTGARLLHQFWPQNDTPTDTKMMINVAGDRDVKEASIDTQGKIRLLEYLEAACRKNGCRKLELESCHFTHANRGFTKKFFGYPSQKEDGYEVNMRIDAQFGSITMFEANV